MKIELSHPESEIDMCFFFRNDNLVASSDIISMEDELGNLFYLYSFSTNSIAGGYGTTGINGSGADSFNIPNVLGGLKNNFMRVQYSAGIVKYYLNSVLIRTHAIPVSIGDIKNIFFKTPKNNFSRFLIPSIFIKNGTFTDNEASYIFNNGLGNEPLSSLVLYYKNNSAIIIDNKIAIAEDSEIEYIEIVNLPAGTLQEQLDYANDNLFEPW